MTNVWVEAARPRTLVAGTVPVLVGTAAADKLIAWRFVAAALVGIAIQVGVNYANDLFDAQRGVDTGERIGPRRATATGLATPTQMRAAMLVAFGVAAAAGLSLAIAVGWELLVVGALCFLAALGYSGGPKPYGSHGLGEVFVFVFFGLVATVGSAYVQTEHLTLLAVMSAVPVGFLASALLVVNNLRDIDTDRASGKGTLAVRLGPDRTRILFAALIAGAFLCLVPIALLLPGTPWTVLIPAGFAALGWLVARDVRRASGPRELIGALKQTALLQLAYGITLAAVLWLS